MRNHDLFDRVWGRVVLDPSPLGDDCWLWQGSLSPGGYGLVSVNGAWVGYIGAPRPGNHGVHRVSFWMAGGTIPDGYEIDHLCRRRHCVNPTHMEAVTPRTNTLRGTSAAAVSARRDCCIHGHPLDGANVYWNGIQRVCRECRRLSARRQLERRNPAAKPYERRPWADKNATDFRRCELEGCDEKYKSNGLCARHYNQWKWRTRG
jgi:hypothetical protein